ncbi:hypothetical protein GGR56DRAFT_172406 [Xylariaceae sp. FL0804]|nr:hypothetical protein GGR56DRAFT_172406 [Xylariaceae sp. FL0804]
MLSTACLDHCLQIRSCWLFLPDSSSRGARSRFLGPGDPRLRCYIRLTSRTKHREAPAANYNLPCGSGSSDHVSTVHDWSFSSSLSRLDRIFACGLLACMACHIWIREHGLGQELCYSSSGTLRFCDCYGSHLATTDLRGVHALFRSDSTVSLRRAQILVGVKLGHPPQPNIRGRHVTIFEDFLLAATGLGNGHKSRCVDNLT